MLAAELIFRNEWEVARNLYETENSRAAIEDVRDVNRKKFEKSAYMADVALL
jgi:hypothetical protein